MPCCRRTADASKRLVLKVLASRDQSPSAALEEDYDDGGDGDGDDEVGDGGKIVMGTDADEDDEEDDDSH